MVCYRTIFARRFFYPFNKFLFNLSLRGIGILNNENGNYKSTGERYFLKKLSSTWGRNPIIIDVGANVGEYSTRCKQLAPGACIYAFEPHPETFDTLRHQAILHGYSAFNLACGDQRSTLDLYDSLEDNGSPHASFYRDVIESLHRGRAVAHKVEVIVLDEFIAEQGIHSVDLVKIDTEGHELRVLAGLRKTISKDIIHVIQFEFNAMHVISRSFLRDFVELLPQYRLYRILRDGLVPLGEYSPVFCELYAFQNVVAIRKGYTLKV